ncbi:hypothetical protein ACFLY2_02915 [Patescibacteria group bacterium]
MALNHKFVLRHISCQSISICHTLQAAIIYQLHVVPLHTIISSSHVSKSIQSANQSVVQYITSHVDVQQPAIVHVVTIEIGSHPLLLSTTLPPKLLLTKVVHSEATAVVSVISIVVISFILSIFSIIVPVYAF